MKTPQGDYVALNPAKPELHLIEPLSREEYIGVKWKHARIFFEELTEGRGLMSREVSQHNVDFLSGRSLRSYHGGAVFPYTLPSPHLARR